MANLASLYRPKTFEEVFGQEVPVRFLSQLIIRGQVCRNVLLHGAIGSGKTTLARIYAKALNCERPSSCGSPCLGCKACEAIEAGDRSYFAELDTPSFRSFDQFKSMIDGLLAARGVSQRRVIFVDEAHSLSNYRDSFNFLLKKVEESEEEGIAFCFATTAFDRISEALKSRLICLEIRPLLLRESVKFLERVVVREGITAETEALTLLAGLGEGQPRNMLQGLDQVSATGDVTRDRVRATFGVGYTDVLIDYFVALGEGDFERQTDILFRWNEGVREKLRLVQLFMVSLYYNDLRGIRLSIDPLIASIVPQERSRIVETFRKRLGEDGMVVLWESMMGLWPVITPDLAEESLLLLIVEFQRRGSAPIASMNQARSAAGSTLLQTDSASPRARRTAARVRKGAKGHRVENDPKYLSFDQVRELFNAASFLVQEYNSRFNAQITIRTELFRCKKQAEASKLLSDFNHALDGRLKYWIKDGHRLTVQENSEQEGFCGRIAAVLPVEDARVDERMLSWLARWRRDRRVRGQEDEAIIWQPAPVKVKKLDFHWECVRWLCAGLNPKEPIYRSLKLRNPRIAGMIGAGRRYSTSESLGPAALADATRNQMELLSAFDDEAWDRLYDGWELDEYVERRRHKAERKRAIEEIFAKFPADAYDKENERKQQDALAELRRTWPDRCRRPRSWVVWTI